MSEGTINAKFYLNGILIGKFDVEDRTYIIKYVVEPANVPVGDPESTPEEITLHSLVFTKHVLVSRDGNFRDEIVYVCNNHNFYPVYRCSNCKSLNKVDETEIVKSNDQSIKIKGAVPEANDNFWELVNKKTGEDILEIVLGLVNGMISPSATMDRIARRCDVVYELAKDTK